MTSTQEFIFSLLLLMWVAQAAICLYAVRRYSHRIDKQSRDRVNPFMPPAVVIVPFKGVDIDMDAAIRALCEQDYSEYELILVVESESDPAYSILQEQLARYPARQSTIIVAGLAPANVSQKIHNQLCAIDHIQPVDTEQVWVFVDSDAVPGEKWIRTLVHRLGERDRTGVITGYRWLIPVPGTSIWSDFASVINSSVACLQSVRDDLNQAWGGSMAVLASTARKGDLRGRLTGSLTDDYPMSRMCRDLGLRVYMPNRALVPSPVDFTLGSFLNFAYRQYVITRVYVPLLFYAVLGVLTLYVAGFAAACYALFTPMRWWAVTAMAVVFLANQLRASMRSDIIDKVLGPQAFSDLRRAMFIDRFMTTACMTLNWLLVLRACFGSTFDWRGKKYRLAGPQNVTRFD